MNKVLGYTMQDYIDIDTLYQFRNYPKKLNSLHAARTMLRKELSLASLEQVISLALEMNAAMNDGRVLFNGTLIQQFESLLSKVNRGDAEIG